MGWSLDFRTLRVKGSPACVAPSLGWIGGGGGEWRWGERWRVKAQEMGSGDGDVANIGNCLSLARSSEDFYSPSRIELRLYSKGILRVGVSRRCVLLPYVGVEA